MIMWLILVSLLSFPSVIFGAISVTSQASRIKLNSATSKFIVSTAIDTVRGIVDAKQDPANNLQGSAGLVCDNAFLDLANYSGYFSGTLDLTSENTLKLYGSSSFYSMRLVTIPYVAVLGVSNSLSGVIKLGWSLTITNSMTQCNYGLHIPCNQTIVLNGGTIIADHDITFEKDLFFTGSGTIQLGAARLNINNPSTTLTSTLYFSGPTYVNLVSDTVLTGAWNIPAGADVIINGNGNVLDISQGKINIPSGASLQLQHARLKGLTSAAPHLILFDGTSRVHLTNSTLYFDTDFTFSTGNLVVDADRTMFVVANKIVTFANSGTLNVEKATLNYDTLTYPDQQNIQPLTDGVNVIVTGNGQILPREETRFDNRLVFDATSHALYADHQATYLRPLTFSGANSSAITLDGNDHHLSFAVRSVQLASIAANKRIQMTNIYLEHFDPARFSYGTGCRPEFGENVFATIAPDATLTKTWYCMGNAQIDGNGHQLTLQNGTSFVIASGKTLTLTDIILNNVGDLNGTFLFEDTTSTLSLRNVTLRLASSYTPTMGNFYWYGGPSCVITGTNILTFSTNATCSVNDMVLNYDPLDSADVKNIKPTAADGLRMVSIGNGTVRLTESALGSGSLKYGAATNYLQRNEDVLEGKQLDFSSASNGTTILDGQGFLMRLPSIASALIIVPSGKKAVLRNMVVRDFIPDHFNPSAGGEIIFGDGCTVEVAQDMTLNYGLTFQGNALLDLKSHAITFGPLGYFSVSATSTAQIKNGAVRNFGSMLKMLDPTSTFMLNSAQIMLSNNYSLTQGYFSVHGDSSLTSSYYTFAIKSSQPMTMYANAQLVLSRGLTFSYDSSNRYGINQLADSSRIYLDGATLHTTSTGVRISGGQVIVAGRSTFEAEGLTNATSIQISSGTNVTILANAMLDIKGCVVSE